MSTPLRKQAIAPSPNASDLHGANRLAIDAITGVTDLVEAMHASIAGLPGIFGTSTTTTTRGVPSLVYRSVRGVARLVGSGVDFALTALAPLLGRAVSVPQREAVLAALNGVLGDHLTATANPLAIGMQLRHAGQALVLRRKALTDAFPQASRRILVLAHGLCMNDLQWNYGGHDHGAALAQELGYTPLYLHYNTGLRVSENGRALSDHLQRVIDAWPVPVEELVIVGHSMGGLVARAACIVAEENEQAWLAHLRKLVFLGTPHHGAPLERAGSWVDLLIGLSPYTAPFARLAKVRSAGIQDLRHGNVRDEDWTDRDGDGRQDGRSPSPLPAHVRAYAIAATTQALHGDSSLDHVHGDGLVRVASAFGQHPDRRFALRIPASRRAVADRTNHLELLGSAKVHAHLRRWLA